MGYIQLLSIIGLIGCTTPKNVNLDEIKEYTVSKINDIGQVVDQWEASNVYINIDGNYISDMGQYIIATKNIVEVYE